jgi:hypothetical protein
LPISVTAFPDQKPPRRTCTRRCALGQAGARAARALHGPWGCHPRPTSRHPAPRHWGGGDWGAGRPCCSRATVMWPSRVSPF